MTGEILTHDLVSEILRDLTKGGVEVSGPISTRPISGGRSNVTIHLSDGTSEWVMRMPPRNGDTKSAHDIEREYRVTRALSTSSVPVPKPLVFSPGNNSIAAPYMISSYVRGATIQTRRQLDVLNDDQVASTVRQLVSTLVNLHALDPEVVGLGQLGRHHGYTARQLSTWTRQWASHGPPKLSGLHRAVVNALEKRVSDQVRTSVLHGDFRLDNTLFSLGPEPELLAIVDWVIRPEFRSDIFDRIGNDAEDVFLRDA